MAQPVQVVQFIYFRVYSSTAMHYREKKKLLRGKCTSIYSGHSRCETANNTMHFRYLNKKCSNLDKMLFFNIICHTFNLFQSFAVLWKKLYFQTSDLLCLFTSVKSRPLVLLPVFISKQILGPCFHNHSIT